MQQIHKGIQQKYSTMEQFKDDIYLMFQNARTYNGAVPISSLERPKIAADDRLCRDGIVRLHPGRRAPKGL